MDGYGNCDHCLWWGKLRRDGAVRRHHRADPDNGHRQNPNLGVCPGSGGPQHVFLCE